MIVVFDLDGTLIDSAPDIHATANAVLGTEGLRPLDLATVRGFIGRGVPHLVAHLLDAHGIADPAAEARMLDGFARRYDAAVGLTRPYAGVPAALGRLAGAGHRLAICTNKPAAAARAVLRHLGLLDHFPVVVGGDSGQPRKPDPAPLRRAVREAGGGAALFVGDSEVDAECAAAAGLALLLFTGGYRRAPVSQLEHALAFDSFDDLPGLIEGWPAAPVAGAEV